jgi:Ni,Fe-hydrogenase III large subunit/Ni,Fe-hydrogenase III component G
MTVGTRTTTDIGADELHDLAASLFDTGHRLAAVVGHDDGEFLRVVYVFTSGPPDLRRELVVRLDAESPAVPTLSDLSFSASRFERELHDNFGIVPLGHPFLRPLVRHQHWPEHWYPLRNNAGTMPAERIDAAPYPFIEVRGSGVYEIPVGPVHAGLIEPGHFRFSVVGETILKMTARLWYVHRGIERMFQGADIDRGLEIAERISGDTAVGHTLAYCMAVEEALGLEVSEEAWALRSMLLELERMYNHVGDVGALCNDVSFGVANARALAIRERLLRLNEEVTGHRLLRGSIRVGATSVRTFPTGSELAQVGEAFDALVQLARSNTVVVDRFEGTAVLAAADAAAIGTIGVVGRASGLAIDARASHPFYETDRGFVPAVQSGGDVMARFDQRVDEFHASLEMVRRLNDLATGLSAGSASSVDASRSGLGIAEGWRGTIVHRVELDASGRISRARTVDPSFLNWPALSVALSDTIVPDFPLANKSFNLSYAGNDL